jgi:hypothetical protein
MLVVHGHLGRAIRKAGEDSVLKIYVILSVLNNRLLRAEKLAGSSYNTGRSRKPTATRGQATRERKGTRKGVCGTGRLAWSGMRTT